MNSNLMSAPHAILQLAKLDKPTILEKEFVTTWLLTLRSYVLGEDIKIGMWLDHMDMSPFMEATVVDAQGVALYDVPSIFVSQDKVLPKNIADNIGDIMYRAENMNKIIPGQGDNFIQTQLTNNVTMPKEVPDHQRRWDEIFKRYDLEPVFDIPSAVGTTHDDVGEFDDYEDL